MFQQIFLKVFDGIKIGKEYFEKWGFTNVYDVAKSNPFSGAIY